MKVLFKNIIAYDWALNFSDDKEKLIQFISEYDVLWWVSNFPEDREYFKKKGLLK